MTTCIRRFRNAAKNKTFDGRSMDGTEAGVHGVLQPIAIDVPAKNINTRFKKIFNFVSSLNYVSTLHRVIEFNFARQRTLKPTAVTVKKPYFHTRLLRTLSGQ